MEATLTTRPQSLFQLKGSLFTFTVLQIESLDLDKLAAELESTLEKTPQFFNNAPVVLDISHFAETEQEVPFLNIVKILRQKNLFPVGIKGGSPAQNESAIAQDLAILPNHRPSSSESMQTETKQATKVITKPVRSGQQIYAKGGDLTVIASVSPGAELLADGNIHVYGPLRGRALAGVGGDQNAHVFCQSLDAELIAIAGRYRVKEDLQMSSQGQTIHIFLKDERLHFETL